MEIIAYILTFILMVIILCIPFIALAAMLASIALPIILVIYILVSVSQIKKAQREQTAKLEEVRKAILFAASKREPQEPKERWPYTPPAE